MSTLPTVQPSEDVIRTHIERGNYSTAVEAVYPAVMASGIDDNSVDIDPAVLIELVSDALTNGAQGSRQTDGKLATIVRYLVRHSHLTETARLSFCQIARKRGFRATKIALQKPDSN